MPRPEGQRSFPRHLHSGNVATPRRASQQPFSCTWRRRPTHTPRTRFTISSGTKRSSRSSSCTPRLESASTPGSTRSRAAGRLERCPPSQLGILDAAIAFDEVATKLDAFRAQHIDDGGLWAICGEMGSIRPGGWTCVCSGTWRSSDSGCVTTRSYAPPSRTRSSVASSISAISANEASFRILS